MKFRINRQQHLYVELLEAIEGQVGRILIRSRPTDWFHCHFPNEHMDVAISCRLREPPQN